MKLQSIVHSKRLWGYLFIAPAILHLLIFRVGPTINIAVLSFRPQMLMGVAEEAAFTLRNYRSLMSPRFYQVLFNSGYYVVGGLVVVVAGSLLVALLLNRGPAKGLFRAIYFYPYTVIMVATGIIWAYGFRADGFVNRIIAQFGIEPLNWLGGDGSLAMPALIATTSWRYVGYFAVIFLSGLQAIPATLYDAAKVDGAGIFQQFRHVTLPQLKPIALFVMVMSSVELLRQFAIPLVVTSGGPANSTNVLPLDIYNRAFSYSNMNQAAAESLILILLAVSLAVVQFKVMSRMKGEH